VWFFVCARLMTSCLQYVRTYIQASSVQAQGGRFSSVAKLVVGGGIVHMWKGLLPTLFRGGCALFRRCCFAKVLLMVCLFAL
jgi:hypothetical protein